MYRDGRRRLGDAWWDDPTFDQPVDVAPIDVSWPDVYTPPQSYTLDFGLYTLPEPYSPDRSASVVSDVQQTDIRTDYNPIDLERQPPSDFLVSASGDPVEEAIQHFYTLGRGDTLAADGAAMRARAADIGGNDEVLRNAQHALVTQQAIEEYGVAGAAMALVAVPAYSAAKWVAQNVPGAAAVLQPFSNDPLTREGGASAPSWSEVWWGLKPIWAPLK